MYDGLLQWHHGVIWLDGALNYTDLSTEVTRKWKIPAKLYTFAIVQDNTHYFRLLRFLASVNILQYILKRKSRADILCPSMQGSFSSHELWWSTTHVARTRRHPQITTKAPDVCNALNGVINRLEHNAVVVLLCNGIGAYEELISDERFRNISCMLAVTTNGVYTTER